MKRRVLSKTTPFPPFKKKKKKRGGEGQNSVVLNDTVHLSSSPPNMQRGRRKEKWSFFLNFCRPLSRLEPTDRTQWPTTHRAPPTEPRQPRPMADQPAAPRESCKKTAPLASINRAQERWGQGGRRERKTRKKKKNAGPEKRGGNRREKGKNEKKQRRGVKKKKNAGERGEGGKTFWNGERKNFKTRRVLLNGGERERAPKNSPPPGHSPLSAISSLHPKQPSLSTEPQTDLIFSSIPAAAATPGAAPTLPKPSSSPLAQQQQHQEKSSSSNTRNRAPHHHHQLPLSYPPATPPWETEGRKGSRGEQSWRKDA